MFDGAEDFEASAGEEIEIEASSRSTMLISGSPCSEHASGVVDFVAHEFAEGRREGCRSRWSSSSTPKRRMSSAGK